MRLALPLAQRPRSMALSYWRRWLRFKCVRRMQGIAQKSTTSGSWAAPTPLWCTRDIKLTICQGCSALAWLSLCPGVYASKSASTAASDGNWMPTLFRRNLRLINLLRAREGPGFETRSK